jgi:hypothetical protein
MKVPEISEYISKLEQENKKLKDKVEYYYMVLQCCCSCGSRFFINGRCPACVAVGGGE